MKTKDTHTTLQIEELMYDYTDRIKNAETKTEKQALIKKLKSLEKHFNSIQEKNLNGRKLPVRKVPKDIPKKELLVLIDSVPDGIDYTKPEYELGRKYMIDKIHKELDTSGIFPPFTSPRT